MNDLTKILIILCTIALITGLLSSIILSSPKAQERMKLVNDCKNACLGEGYVYGFLSLDEVCICDATQKVVVIK